MKKIFLLFTVIAIFNANAQQRPKLVVGIVVDQMKMEYLYRFSDDFSANGFRRLMNDGYVFHNTHYNYMPTYTAPGHASIYTGTTPAVHGIVGNSWFDKNIGKSRYCTDDTSVSILGTGDSGEGKMSPVNLESTTITDELRMATNFKGKVIGISVKDRGAILPAGHFANWAFWLSDSGNFISSTFYGKQLPNWVSEFNAKKNYVTYLNKDWTLLKPESVYDKSLADDNPYEGLLYGSKKPVFPYNLKEMYASKGAKVIKSTPFGNDFLADFAKEAIANEGLGEDAVTDFLAVSFSSTDYVGHLTGPRSREIQDTYLRLDNTIADFLAYLDKKVGKDNYLLFLTADHAAAENVSFLKDNKYALDVVGHKELSTQLREFSKTNFGSDLILNYSNYNLFFDKKQIQEKGLSLDKVKLAFKDFLMKLPQVKRVYTEEEILAGTTADYFLTFVTKGYDSKQNGELVILDKAGYIEHEGTGTSHGTPYSYDTHVPLLFYGWNIKKGESFDKKVITQIAPTIAQKIKVTFPNGTESNVLTEVLDK
ncbi:alkaline phosphatase family protein [Flavobacterium sufflavum]|uniref:Alkaline phosphatase family protein n=1 Tax=Flavobacterium sufflavum TaxID=1921138 RepID=A0A3S2V153_9FLAO|nr:alkaline phosphatase PafA [Flavobacterium sufflavum]RVT72290.1 alkaline phosphatase family protein [Flavobacterium sufflavum]